MSDEKTQQTTTQTPEQKSRGQKPTSEAFKASIGQGWAPREVREWEPRESAPHASRRRGEVSAAFPGERLVFPAGPFKQRANDTEYKYRPHSAFAHLTGLGRDEEPDAVLVLEPTDAGHDAVLYFLPLAGRDTAEFYSNPQCGELWVGARPTLDDYAQQLQVSCRHIDELTAAMVKGVADGGTRVRVIREADVTVTSALDAARVGVAEGKSAEGDETISHADTDDELARFVSELRLVKDEYEIAQMREAVAATIKGFEEIARAMPKAVAHTRGERVLEMAFETVARTEGNGVGYDTIAAAGDHACTLHWTRNDGAVKPGELVLIDAGVELDSLYTGDLTRTLPINGTFTPMQRKVYQAVLDAADAAFAVIKPGVLFREVHLAAMRVIAERIVEWGLVEQTLEETLDEKKFGLHRRWMVHGTSHHLGIDVHDCAQARREKYVEAELREGMVFTVEPGMYFKSDDLSVPEEYRGIGVRIEDDILVTADGYERLSTGLPRTADDVEAWMRSMQAQ